MSFHLVSKLNIISPPFQLTFVRTFFPPSYLMAKLLQTLTLATAPFAESTWPVYVTHMANIDTDCLATYDTVGLFNGRSMNHVYEDDYIEHYGVSLRCRCTNPDDGWLKMELISEGLAVLNEYSYMVEGAPVIIHSIIQSTPIVDLGLEYTGDRNQSGERKYLYTLNFLMVSTISQVVGP